MIMRQRFCGGGLAVVGVCWWWVEAEFGTQQLGAPSVTDARRLATVANAITAVLAEAHARLATLKASLAVRILRQLGTRLRWHPASWRLLGPAVPS